jgi:hypothetical protein
MGYWKIGIIFEGPTSAFNHQQCQRDRFMPFYMHTIFWRKGYLLHAQYGV